MALNFSGLGFSFGAKDMGLSAMQEKFSAGFLQMQTAVQEMGQQVQPAFDKVGASVQTGLDTVKQALGSSLNFGGELFKKVTERARPFTDSLVRMGRWAGGFGKAFKQGVVETLKQGSFFFKKKSDDIKKSQQTIAGGFGEIKEVVRKLNDILRVNRLAGFVGAVSLGVLGKIKSGIGAVANSSGELSTSLEAMGVAASKQARQTAVNLGLTGKELKSVSKQAAGMSIGLNIGADTAATSIVGWTKATKEMRAVGIGSATDLAKLSEVVGVNGKEFSNMLIRMRKEMGFSDAQMKLLTSSFTAMGQQTGDVSGALGAMPEILDLLSEKAALMGAKLDPKQLAEYAAQTAGLAAGLGKMGLSADKARGMSIELAQSVVQAQKQLQNMYAGTQSELPDMVRELSIAGQDIDFAFSQISKGPSGFVKGLAHMALAAKEQGADVGHVMEFMRARLEQAGVQGIGPLVNFMRSADKSMLQTIQSVETANIDLGKLAKEGYSSGRTLQESFELAEQGFVESFRSIGKGRFTFVQETTKAFGTISRAMKSSTGTTRVAIGLFADMHALGAKALLPDFLQPYAHILGVIQKNMAGVIAVIAGLTFAFGPLGGAVGLVLAALVFFQAILYRTKKQTGSWEKAFLKIGEDIANFFKKLPFRIVKALTKLDNLFVWLRKGLRRAMSGKGGLFGNDFVKGIGQNLMASLSMLWSYIKGFARGFWKGLTGQFDPKGPEGASASADVAAMLGTALRSALQTVATFFTTTLWPAVVGVFKGLIAGLLGAADPETGENKTAAERFGQSVGEFIRKGLDKAYDLVRDYLKDWWRRVRDIWADESAPFSLKVQRTFQESGGIIVGALAVNKIVPISGALGTLGKALSALPWGSAVSGASSLGSSLSTLLSSVGALPAALAAVAAITAALFVGFLVWPEKTEEMVSGVRKWLSEAGENLAKWLTDTIVSFIGFSARLLAVGAKFIADFMKDPKKAFETLQEDIKKAIEDFDVGPALEMLFVRIPTALAQTIDTVTIGLVRSFLGGFFKGLAEKGKEYFPELGKFWDVLIQTFDDFSTKSVPELARTFVDNFFKALGSEKVEGAFEPLRKLLDENILPPLKEFWGIVKTIGDYFKESLATQINIVWTLIKVGIGLSIMAFLKLEAKLKHFWYWLMSKLVPIWEMLKQKAVEAWETLRSKWDEATGFFERLWNVVWGKTQETWNDIKNLIVGIWENDIKPKWEEVKDFFADIFNQAGLQKPFEELLDWLTTSWTTLEKELTAVKDFFSRTFDAIQASMRAAFEYLQGKGKKMLEPFLEALKLADKIIDGFRTKHFDHSIHTSAARSLGLAGESFEVFAASVEGQMRKADKALDPLSAKVSLLKNQAAMLDEALKMKKAVGFDAKMKLLTKLAASIAGGGRGKGTEVEGPRTAPMPPLVSGTGGLEQAIHQPDWWSGRGGYSEMFRKEMSALRQQVADLGRVMAATAPTPGRTQQPPGLITAARGRPARTNYRFEAEQPVESTLEGLG